MKDLLLFLIVSGVGMLFLLFAVALKIAALTLPVLIVLWFLGII